jgi:hypothetical protein
MATAAIGIASREFEDWGDSDSEELEVPQPRPREGSHVARALDAYREADEHDDGFNPTGAVVPGRPTSPARLPDADPALTRSELLGETGRTTDPPERRLMRSPFGVSSPSAQLANASFAASASRSAREARIAAETAARAIEDLEHMFDDAEDIPELAAPRRTKVSSRGGAPPKRKQPSPRQPVSKPTVPKQAAPKASTRRVVRKTVKKPAPKAEDNSLWASVEHTRGFARARVEVTMRTMALMQQRIDELEAEVERLRGATHALE